MEKVVASVVPQPSAALGALQRAQKVALLVNTASELRLVSRHSDALKLLGEALALNPDYAPAHFNRGMVYYSLHRLDEMMADFDRAIQLAPDHAEMFELMAVPLVHLERYGQALAVLGRAVKLEPLRGQAWLWICRCYYQLGDDARAYSVLGHALTLCPNHIGLRLTHALYLSRVSESREEIDRERARFMRSIDQLMAEGVTLTEPERQLHIMPSSLPYHGLNDKPLMQRMAALMLSACPDLAYAAPHCAPGKQRKPGPIRIGFQMETAHLITVKQFVGGIMRELKKDEDFEVFLITNSPLHLLDMDEIKEISHHLVPFGYQLPQARHAIAGLELDILIYMEVVNYHMSYLLSFARLAPVQCAMGGFPVTTAVPNMDYFITTEIAEPPESAQHYTETPLLLSRPMTTFKMPRFVGETKSKEEYGLPGGDARIYLCPVFPHKLHPDMDRIFAEILLRDPQSHIVLFAARHSVFQTCLDIRLRRTITPENYARVHFLPEAPVEKFLHILSLADVLLDTLYYSFGTTAYLALGIGMPFVTHRGEFMRGRAGVFMYERMNMPEMIADSIEDYITLAIDIANCPEKREALAQRIRERCAQFFDDYGIVPEVVARLRALHAQHAVVAEPA